MIHIVGTNHELQHTAKPFRAPADANRLRDELKAYLRQLALEISPAVIAEEFCQEVLDIKSAASITKAVAVELGIEHRFVDPDAQKRQELGIPLHGSEHCGPSERTKHDHIREAYWLERLSDVRNQTVLFVCGAEHVASFSGLLCENRIARKVQEEYFGKEAYPS